MTRVIDADLATAISFEQQMDTPSGDIKGRIERLRAIRNELGWSEEVCAYHLGVAYSTLNRWERGESMPRSRVVVSAIDRFIAKYGKQQASEGAQEQTGGEHGRS